MRSLKHQKILIFGSSGFLGSHLSIRLPRAYRSDVDVTNKAAVSRLIKSGWNVIINLAGLSGTVSSQTHAVASFATNVLGSLNILEATRTLSRPPILFFSNSRQEYGRPQYLPVDENHPTNPTNLYGIHKLSITQLAQIYFYTYHLPTIVFRTSNVYGPTPDKNQHDYNVVNQWLKSDTITIFGSGRQSRDYLFIHDWVDAVIKALTNSKAYGQIFNIGYGEGLSLLSMAKTVAHLTGAKIIHQPWPQDFRHVETGSYITNISKAKKILNWQPRIDFIAGVKKTLHETTI